MYRSRVSFFVFVLVMTAACYIAMYMAYKMLSLGGWDWSVITGMVIGCLGIAAGTVVGFYSVRHGILSTVDAPVFFYCLRSRL